jgi:hypothetical protein
MRKKIIFLKIMPNISAISGRSIIVEYFLLLAASRWKLNSEIFIFTAHWLLGY